MQYDDDIAFQRAILANPADTTLKLVYADWLQDRADPRAEYVRLQVQLISTAASYSASELAELLSEKADGLAPAWIAFMNTLAQPFVPISFQRSPEHPFTERVGWRGNIVVFESQLKNASEWSADLLTDLAFVTSTGWDECAYGAASSRMYGFVCALPTDRDPLSARDVITALKVSNFRSEHIANLDATEIDYPGYHPGTVNDEIHTEFTGQYMFVNDREGADELSPYANLKNYVAGGRLWYALLHMGEKPCPMVTLLAVGRSPHGNRLVGAITSQVCHNLCD